MSGCSFFEGATGPIIYYQGTFDPVHKGHLSALEAAIEGTGASGAVVVVGDEPNPDKPDRLPVDIRREMLNRMFASLVNVSVSPLSQKETKQALFARHRVIALIGSDACHLYVDRVKTGFHAFCVSLREIEERACPTTLSGKDVIAVVPSVRGRSSSQIKHYLRSHPEVYETAVIEPGSPLDQLDASVLDFILKNQIYRQEREEGAHPLKRDIEHYVSNLAFRGNSCICTYLTINSLEGQKESGRSGDLTFSVVSGKERVFVKAYIRPSHIMDCNAEDRGMELINSLSLSWAHALKPIGTWHRSSHSFLVVPYLELPDLAKVFKNAQDPTLSLKLIHMCFCVGRALSELHCHRLYPAEEKVIQEETRLLNERTIGRLQKLPVDQRMEIQKLFCASYEAYLKNPGMHTYVHGDADLSNFVVDKTDKVTLIDIGRLSMKRTKEGEPLGCPAEDYYRFFEGIYWFNFWLVKEGLLPLSVIEAAQKAFKEGYATFPSVLTEEAHHYFSNYWKIKNSKFNPDLLACI